MRCKQYILLRDYKSLIGLCMQIVIYPSVKSAYLIYLENFNHPKNKSQYEICFHNAAQLITCRQQHYQHLWSLIISFYTLSLSIIGFMPPSGTKYIPRWAVPGALGQGCNNLPECHPASQILELCGWSFVPLCAIQLPLKTSTL